ncbi:MAG: hypothetical protein PHQ60_14400 [Sideroxydans sp.]|nr:hypothetical protein [Sideroxydans sp.]
MNNFLKIHPLIAAALLSLPCISYGGMLKEEAVRKQAMVNIATRDNSESCISVDLNRPAPEISGFPGISPAAVPGRFAVTLLRQTNLRDQAVRDIQIEQMDYLTTQGFFTATDRSIATDSGALPARTYQMTWQGFANNQTGYGNALCFNYGRREFAGIEKTEKSPETVMDMDVYDVTYTIKLADAPAWTQSPEAKRLFPKLRQLSEDGKGHVKVVRTHSGWRSTYEIEIEAAQASRGQTNNYAFEMQKSLLRQPPTLELARQQIALQAGDTSWLARNSIACLPLQLQRGGDDKPVPGTMRQSEAPTPFTATYYDKADRKPYELGAMYKALHILSALEHAGLAKMERIKPLLAKDKPANESCPPAADAQNDGVRFTLTPEAAQALELSGYGSGCIPAGRIALELLDVQGIRGSYQIKARGVLSQTPDWASKIGEQLPALKSLLDNGVQMTGQLNYASYEGEGQWRLSGLSPIYPEINYNSVPPQLAALFPRTLAAFPVPPIKAPALMQQDQARAAFNALPAAAAAAPYTMQTTAPVAAPALPAKPAPYPAEGAPVHVVSIYQANFPQDMPRKFQEHPEGKVNLKVSANNAVLLLHAYEPVEWHIEAAHGVELKQVIAIGFYEPRVTLSGGGKPKVFITREIDIMQRMGTRLFNRFPTNSEANDLIDIAAATRALTAAAPATVQASNQAPASGFSISAKTPAFALPPPLKPAPNGTRISLQSAFTEAVNGNTLRRGPAGAYTDAWSDHAFSAGKLYYEGKMKVTGALAAHTHANIGLCLERGKGIDVPPMPGGTTVISHGEQKLYKDGDIFGIAADLDRGKLYFSVNGQWLSGTPDNGNGFPLENGKHYRACVLAAGTVTSEVKQGIPQSDTTWEVNFGERPFKSPKPSGYVAFNGTK